MKYVYTLVIIALILCLSNMFTSNDEKPTVTFHDMSELPLALDMPIKNEP
jgi:hypothetical protein